MQVKIIQDLHSMNSNRYMNKIYQLGSWMRTCVERKVSRLPSPADVPGRNGEKISYRYKLHRFWDNKYCRYLTDSFGKSTVDMCLVCGVYLVFSTQCLFSNHIILGIGFFVLKTCDFTHLSCINDVAFNVAQRTLH